MTGVYLEQLYTFGKPDRDPRERIISVAYYALAPSELLTPVAGSDAAAVAWFELDALPSLAFDHRDVIAMAQQRLRAKLDYSTVAFGFMQPEFTLGELQKVYETIRGEALDKRNFRKHILALGLARAKPAPAAVSATTARPNCTASSIPAPFSTSSEAAMNTQPLIRMPAVHKINVPPMVEEQLSDSERASLIARIKTPDGWSKTRCWSRTITPRPSCRIWPKTPAAASRIRWKWRVLATPMRPRP